MDFFKQYVLPVELTTTRLKLRKLLVKDAVDMYAYAQLENVTKYLLWNPHPSLSYTEKYLKYLQNEYKKERFFDWAIVYTAENKMIGTVGFTQLDKENLVAEIGYVINPEYAGKGIATEAVWAVLGYAFNHLGMQRIEARYMIGNDASLRVMEKCGMKKEGILRSALLVKDVRRDIGICSILRNEYFAMRGEIGRV